MPHGLWPTDSIFIHFFHNHLALTTHKAHKDFITFQLPYGYGLQPYPYPISWPKPTSASFSMHCINKLTCSYRASNYACIFFKVLCMLLFDRLTKDLPPPPSLYVRTIPVSLGAIFDLWQLLWATLPPVTPPLYCSLDYIGPVDCIKAFLYDRLCVLLFTSDSHCSFNAATVLL